LRFNGLAIDQGGLITPLLNGFQDIGKKVCGTVDWLHVFDAAVLADRGGDADYIDGADLVLGNLWIDAPHQSADNYFFISIEGPQGVVGGHTNGTLDLRGNGRRFQDAFSGQIEVGAVIAALKMDFHGLAFGRIHLNHGLNDGLNDRRGVVARGDGSGAGC